MSTRRHLALATRLTRASSRGRARSRWRDVNNNNALLQIVINSPRAVISGLGAAIIRGSARQISGSDACVMLSQRLVVCLPLIASRALRGCFDQAVLSFLSFSLVKSSEPSAPSIRCVCIHTSLVQQLPLLSYNTRLRSSPRLPMYDTGHSRPSPVKVQTTSCLHGGEYSTLSPLVVGPSILPLLCSNHPSLLHALVIILFHHHHPFHP